MCAARYCELLWPCGRGFKVSCFGLLVGCRMVESPHSGAFVGMVAGGPGAAYCRQPMGRRSRFNPCMPGRLSVGWLACGLFIVGSLFCSSLVGSRLCSPRWCSRTLISLSSPFVLRIAAAGLSGVVDVLRPGRARCVVLVRWCWFTSGRPVPGIVVVRMGPAGRVWSLYLSLRDFFPIWRVFSWCARFQDVRACGCCVVVSALVDKPSSPPPNGWLVLPLDA